MLKMIANNNNRQNLIAKNIAKKYRQIIIIVAKKLFA